MPEPTGKKGLNKPARSRGVAPAKRGPLARQQVLTRAKALRRLKQLLTKPKNGIPEEVVEIMSLFQLHVDELTEAGISYEVVKALLRHYPLLLQDE